MNNTTHRKMLLSALTPKNTTIIMIELTTNYNPVMTMQVEFYEDAQADEKEQTSKKEREFSVLHIS